MPNNEGFYLDIPARITPTRLELVQGLEYEDARQALFRVAQVRNAINWWMGDILNYMEIHYGELYAQAASESGIREETMVMAHSVARRVAPETRVADPSWSHHLLVAKLPAAKQVIWLDRAIAQRWTVREMRQAMLEAANPQERARKRSRMSQVER